MTTLIAAADSVTKEHVEMEFSYFFPNVLNQLGECIMYGWQQWSDLCNHHPDVRHGLTDTTRANIIHNKTAMRVNDLFSGEKGIWVIDDPFVAVNIADRFLIRFKKLDECMLPSNIPTDVQRKFTHQLCLPGLVPTVNLTAGYQLDRFGSQITRLSLIYQVGNYVRWSIELPMPDAVTVAPHIAVESDVVKVSPAKHLRDVDSEQAGA